MAQLWFYQLESSLEKQLAAQLSLRAFERGWPVYIRSTKPDVLREIDHYLWEYDQNSFLPHLMADEEGAAQTPILLGQEERPPFEPAMELLLHGAQSTDLPSLTRSIIGFSKNDQTLTETVRHQWKKAQEDGLEPVFWRQNQQGRWTKQE